MKTRRVPRGRLAAAGLLFATSVWAAAQPFAADGGFDRPRAIAREQSRPVAALALDRGEAVLVRVEGDALVAQPLDGGEARTLDAADGVRGVVAAGGYDADLVALWYRRDLTTGRYVHSWTVGGELLRWVQPLDVALVAGDGGAQAFVARGSGDRAWIERLSGAAVDDIVYDTELRLGGLSATAGVGGNVHLTWLEGRTEVTALGTRASWKARAARIDATGTFAGPIDLGPAGGPEPATVTTWVDGRVERLWTAADGVVQRTSHDGSGALVAVPATPIRPGRPVAALGDTVVVAEGHTLWRVDVLAGDGVPVAWSPFVVERASAVRDAAGVVHLAWIGTEPGGDHALYVADDRRPMVRTWRDRLAAALGWSPWNVAQEAAGQVAASALVAVLTAMASAPLLWLAAVLFAGRRSAGTARWRGAWTGAALAPLALAVAIALGGRYEVMIGFVGGAATLAVATLLALAGGGLLWSRRDLEPTPAFVVAGTTSVAIAAALVAFVSFQHWLAWTLI